MKKVIYGVLILLIGFVLFIYNEFNGNLVSQMMSEKALENYLATNYPDKELRVEDGFYNFKFGEYEFVVVESGGNPKQGSTPAEYDFSVRGFIKPEVNWDGIRDANLDEELMDRLGEEAGEEILSLLKKKVENIKYVEVYLEVLKGELDEEVVWDKNIKLDKPIDLYLVLDSTTDGKEDVLKKAKDIQKALNEAGYDYQEVNINGNGFDMGELLKDDKTGYVKFAVSFQKDTKIKPKDIYEEVH